MFRRNVLFLTLVVFSLSGTLYAEEESLHLRTNNAFSFALGYHWYRESNAVIYWHMNEKDYDSFVPALAYERKISKRIGIEVSVGHFRAKETYPYGSGYVWPSIKNLYVSPSVKFYLPGGDTFVFYVGAGPDYYYTAWDLEYRTTGLYYKSAENFSTFGAHGLAGVDWYVYKHPEKHGYYRAPVSLFGECRYTLLDVADVDIKAVNAGFGTPGIGHHLEVGGPMLSIGLRWHW